MRSMIKELNTMDLAYGQKPLTIDEPPNLVQIIKPNLIQGVKNLGEELERALDNPIQSPRLEKIAKDCNKIVITVSDKTRPLPRQPMLQAILSRLRDFPKKNITLIVGCGNHPASSLKELDISESLVSGMTFVNHNSRDKENLVEVGKATTGDIPIMLNRAVAEADLVITIGEITPHYFSGFTGGAKGIHPATAGRETIRQNHKLKPHPRSRLGIINGNLIREEMERAGRMVKNAFCFNVVINGREDVVKAVAGDIVEAHREGVKTSRQICHVPSKQSDIVIVSTGYPQSINVYQITKAIPPAIKIVKPRGVIIAAGACEEGVGDMEFINEMIYKVGFLPILPPNVDIYLVSDLPLEQVRKTFFRPANTVQEALCLALEKLGEKAEVSVIPDSKCVIPITGLEEERDW